MNVYITRINGLSFENTRQYRQYMAVGIAHRLGIREMGIYCYNGESESRESLNARMDGIIAGINRGDLVICQFPTGNGTKFEWALVKHLKAYGSRIAIFLHDLDSLFFENKCTALREVMNLYNQAEVMIVPSLGMRQFLLENGIRKNMKFVIQEMWDYTVENTFFKNPVFKKEIVFIDNEGFEGIKEWESKYSLSLKLYGTFTNLGESQNIHRMNGMNPDEVFIKLTEGGFGLIWYKNEYSHQYMENSISFSLGKFLAAGIPVVVPYGISNQTLIEENHLGLIVHSLEDAVAKIGAMNEEEYQNYVQNVKEFAPALRNGYYTRKCLIEAMQLFYRKDAGRRSIPLKVYDLKKSKFSSTVLKESYGGNLALSWSYEGNTDGFLIYDTIGNLVSETDNIHQHYSLITGYGKESGFTVKAYMETLKGKLVVAESKKVYLDTSIYQDPEVSLIIPAYNAEDYVTRSIDTALAQSFSNLEIIIVDDGSNDSTWRISEWYATVYPNVRAIHQENRGVAEARNTGIKQASGTYIGFMDNDDMIHPKMIERLYHSAKKNDCDIAITSVYQIKDSGYEAFIQYPMEEDIAVTVEAFFEMHFNKGCMFAVVLWNKLYRASLLKSHLIPILIADDDAWTPYILSYADNICYLNDCSYEWDRKIRSSTQVDRWQRRSKEELFQINKDTMMFYLKNGNPERLGLLKQLAKRQLSELGRVYAYEEYGNLWHQIENTFSYSKH